jgi:uncharacterized cupin superfamily protein
MTFFIRPFAFFILSAGSSAFSGATFTPRTPTSLASSYLASLQTPTQDAPVASVAPPTPVVISRSPVTQPTTPSAPLTGTTGFCHVPLHYFSLDQLVSKGPRATYDWGTPQDWSRKLADDGVFRAGSWYCSEGGWPSPNGKAVTEVFYVLEGHGALGDSDGVLHYYGPGDMVIIPKGHTGRWDVHSPIHKVWAVNAHANVEETTSTPIRVRVDHYKDFAPHCLSDTSANDPLYGSTGLVASASKTWYDIGPTRVGVWTCQPGSFAVQNGVRQWFHVLEGMLFITDSSDGTTKRCVPGDTVMLPAGWSGYVDVLEPVKKVFTVAL